MKIPAPVPSLEGASVGRAFVLQVLDRNQGDATMSERRRSMTVTLGAVASPDQTRQPADPAARPDFGELNVFRRGCLSALPDGLVDPRLRTGFCLFLLGAVDRYWYRLHLDDSRFQPYAEDLLCGFGLRPQTAATIVSAIPQLMEDDAARRAILEGAEVFDAWRETNDPNVMLRLMELAAVWKRNGFGIRA
jgi:hypothetical protein